MTIEECYQKMGGDYNEVSTRLPSKSLIEKFVKRFLDDQSFEMLCSGMNAGNREEAFRAAHTLKGVCANLSFKQLMDSSGKLTEVLRPETPDIPEQAMELLEQVREDYKLTADVIRAYCAGEQ